MRNGPGTRTRAALKLTVVALLALTATAGGAFAQGGYFGKNKVQYQSFDWHIYKAPHFDVYYYPEEEASLEQVVSYLESGYLYLSKAMDHEVKFRVPVIYYRTHAEFEQTNVDFSFIPEEALAFAEPLEHRVLLSIDHPPDKLYQVIVHELTHIFEFSILFQDSLGRAVRGGAPGWLMEGLASHMAKDEDNIDKMIIRDAVINGIVPPISKVSGGVTFLTYRYGRAAFDFMESKWGAEGIRTFLSEYRKILLSANIEKSIKEAFGLEAEDFDRLFQRYLRQKYLPTLLEKGEPADYGKEVGIKLPGVMTFSPVLSPSGDLVAVLTNRYYDLDVVILSAKTGEVIKNLTRGFTNDYEFVSTRAFSGQSDLSWSPDGDLVAFFVRKENRRVLLVLNALTGHQVKELEVKAANAASPAFSPDGKKILFSGNLNGAVDIFEIDLETGDVRNITDDEYYDSNPSWSSDGKTILYNRRVDAYEKIFLIDYSDPSRKTQVTFGETSELTPAFSRDGKRLYYTSDLGKDGIFNVFSLDLETGEVRQYTDVAGGYFSPQDRPAEEEKTKVIATSFYGSRFRLYEVNTTKPLKVITPAERAGEVGEMKPFESPLKLTLDESEKTKYTKAKFHVETAPTVGVGFANDGTIFGNAALIFSDLLGDQRFWLFVTSVANYQNTDAGYVNLKHRLQNYYRFVDYRDFILVPDSSTTFSRVKANAETGLFTGLFYPLNRYYRLEGSLGGLRRDILSPQLSEFDDPNTSSSPDVAIFNFDRLKSTNLVLSGAIVGDTLRYNPWGPWSGKRFNLSVQGSPYASGDEAKYVDYSLDYRAYGKATARSLFAWRLGTLVTAGDGATLFGIGGFNQLRGYSFREFIGDRAAWMNLEYRFPLVDNLQFPFGSIRWIRGLIFLDVGAAWTQDGLFFDREISNSSELEGLVSGVFRDFKIYDSDKRAFKDARGSYGLGFNFRMGILELNWTFAKRLPYEVPTGACRAAASAAAIPCLGGLGFCSIDGQVLSDAVNNCTYREIHDPSWRSDFYIGYAF